MKASYLRILALVVSIGACFITTASSQIIITRSPDAPLDSHSAVRIKVPDGGTGTQYQMKWWNTSSSQAAGRHREIGQTFSLSGTEPVAIEGFTFRLNLTSGEQSAIMPGEPITLSIYKVVGAEDATPVGAALYTATGTLPTGMLAADYLTFTLPEAFEATIGTQYSVLIGFNTYATRNQMTFATGSGALYDGGSGFWHQNPNNSEALVYNTYGRDLDFAVLYTPVPEASTVGLLLTSAFLLLAFHFNRRRTRATL